MRKNLKIFSLIFLVLTGFTFIFTILGINHFFDVFSSLIGKLNWADYSALLLTGAIVYSNKSAQENCMHIKGWNINACVFYLFSEEF